MAGRIREAALLTRPAVALAEAVVALTQARVVGVAAVEHQAAVARTNSPVFFSKYARA